MVRLDLLHPAEGRRSLMTEIIQRARCECGAVLIRRFMSADYRIIRTYLTNVSICEELRTLRGKCLQCHALQELTFDGKLLVKEKIRS